MRRICTVLFVSALVIPCAILAGAGGASLDVELVADELVAPLDLTFAPDESGRRFIVDQRGVVLILAPNDEILPDPFLDIEDQVELQSAFDERGLLALAFHPQFSGTGKLYVHYSAIREGPNICVDAEGQIPSDPADCPLQYTRRGQQISRVQGAVRRHSGLRFCADLGLSRRRGGKQRRAIFGERPEGRDTHVAHLASAHEIVESAHQLFGGRTRVPGVYPVEVDVVGV